MGKKRYEGDGWEPRYGNDSRPWLLGMQPDEPPVMSTTTKETYTSDWPPMPSTEGIRKQKLKKELWEKVEKEITEELLQPETTEQPITTYNRTFIKEGFKADPKRSDPELHRKYPLYLDQAVSVWGEKFSSLPGSTRAPHPQHQFRRYAGFTTPLDQLLYDPADAL